MKRLITIVIMAMTVLTAAAKSKLYLVCAKPGAGLSACSINGYSESKFGQPCGVLVIDGSRKLFLSKYYTRDARYATTVEWINSDKNTNPKLMLLNADDINLIADTGYEEINNWIWSARYESNMDVVTGGNIPFCTDICNDPGIWLDNGSFVMADGQIGSADADTKCTAVYKFSSNYIDKINMPEAAAPVKAAGPLKCTVQITAEDKSGADEANRRGYSYMVTDMTITVRNTNGNVLRDPSEKFWVSLVMIHANGKTVEVTPILARPSLSPAIKSDGNGNYTIADPSTYKIRYETRWRDLYNALGFKTIKYKYQVSYRGKVIAETQPRTVTVRNRYVWSEY